MPESIRPKKTLQTGPQSGEANRHSFENSRSHESADPQISATTNSPQTHRKSVVFSAQDSAWLQRVAGNRAASDLLGRARQSTATDKVGSRKSVASPNSKISDGRKGSTTTSPHSHQNISSAINSAQRIQRDVGFEFEVDNTVAPYRKNMLGNYRPLTKRERILTGVDFYIEADGMPGGGSSWEFVTTNFPETMGGLTRLITALNQIDGIIDLMRNSPIQPTVNGVTGPFANFGTVVNNRYFTISNAVFTVKPQVTAGFALEALDEIFNSASNNPGVGVSNLARDTAGMDNFGQAPNPPAPDIPLGQMRTAADNAITVAIPGGPANPALRGLVTQLVQILVAGHQPIGATPKTVMRVALARSDLKATFDTLPAHLHMHFQGNPAAFVNMVMAAANAVSPAALNPAQPVMSGALFTHHQYAGDKRHNMPSPFMQVTRTQWLTSLAAPGGQDLLSKDRYPVRTNVLGKRNKTDQKANKLLNSMGALHNQLDPGNRPIFEIRSSGSLHAGLIQPYALDFFKYVRYLHNPLALTESDELTGMDPVATNDVADLVGFSPNRALVLLNIQANAVTDFNT